MAQLISSPLAIPENIVVGSGGYTVPANKYANFEGNVAIATHVYFGNFANGGQFAELLSTSHFSGGDTMPTMASTATSNKHNQKLVEGDTITVEEDTTAKGEPSNSAVSSTRYGEHYSYILINATPVCIARSTGCAGSRATASFASVGVVVNGASTIGWSVAEFPIPKRNLLPSLIEGN